MLRGALFHGVVFHALQKRFQVYYGMITQMILDGGSSISTWNFSHRYSNYTHLFHITTRELLKNNFKMQHETSSIVLK